MLENTKVNYFNGTSIKECRATSIPHKKLHFLSIDLKINTGRGGREGCSYIEDTYRTDIEVTYSISKNAFKYTFAWWDDEDEDSWGCWRYEKRELTYGEIRHGVFYIEGQMPTKEMIINFFKSCQNNLFVSQIQPYWATFRFDVGNEYTKADKLYDYYINDWDKVNEGDIVKLPNNSFGVVINKNIKRISDVINTIKGYSYIYAEAKLETDPKEIEACKNIIEMTEHKEDFINTKEKLEDICKKIFEGYGEKCETTERFIITLDNKYYMVYSKRLEKEFLLQLLKMLNTSYNYSTQNKLPNELYTYTILVGNYTNARSENYKATKLEFIEDFEKFARKVISSNNEPLFKIESKNIELNILD